MYMRKKHPSHLRLFLILGVITLYVIVKLYLKNIYPQPEPEQLASQLIIHILMAGTD